MKKITIIVTFLVTLLLVTPFVFASSGAPTMIDGASIRTSGEQGLRFYANLENEAVTSQGFYLVYGETSVVNLQTAISNAVEGNVMLNGKKVFKVEVEDREPNGDFSVVLTGIPEVGYLDKITAIAYGVVEDVEVFVSAGTTRSIGEVAYNMVKANEYNQVALDILSSIDSDHRALISTNWETYEESSAIFETNPLILKTQFINDWNAKFGTSLTDLVGTSFHASAIVGKTDPALQGAMTNLTGMRIYTFFKDEAYGLKWGWLLDYIIKYGAIHPARQAVAIKGDGTNNSAVLYDASHFNYSLVNFFNMSNQSGGYDPINFTLPGAKTRYQDVVNFNNKIPRTVSIYNLSKIGDTIVLPQDISKLGKTFDGVYSDGVSSNLVSYTLGQNKILTPIYTNIDYEVKYFDGENELTGLNEMYTVESFITLPNLVKEGYEFIGWFDNPSFSGLPKNAISIGSTGNKNFYARFDIQEIFKVTFVLGEYGYHTKTKQQLFEEFATDYKAFFSLNAKTVNQLLTDWPTHATLTGGLTPMNFFNDSVYGLKWAWFKNYLQYESTRVNYQYNANLFVTPNEQYWRYNLDSFWNNKFRSNWPVSMDFTNIVSANSFWKYTDYNEIIINFDGEFIMFDPSNISIWNSNYEFVGWYDSEVGGSLVTSIEELTSNITLYARYALID